MGIRCRFVGIRRRFVGIRCSFVCIDDELLWWGRRGIKQKGRVDL